MSKNKCQKGELIAKVKFWFGENEPIFNKNHIIEKKDSFAYIYKKSKCIKR